MDAYPIDLSDSDRSLVLSVFPAWRGVWVKPVLSNAIANLRGMGKKFCPLEILFRLQAPATMAKNTGTSASDSVSARRSSQNVARQIVHTAIAGLFCAWQSG